MHTLATRRIRLGPPSLCCSTGATTTQGVLVQHNTVRRARTLATDALPATALTRHRSPSTRNSSNPSRTHNPAVLAPSDLSTQPLTASGPTSKIATSNWTALPTHIPYSEPHLLHGEGAYPLYIVRALKAIPADTAVAPAHTFACPAERTINSLPYVLLPMLPSHKDRPTPTTSAISNT
jgi:hypothetical protein